MTRLTLVTSVDNYTGYGQHGIALIRGLSSRYYLSVRPIRANDGLAKIPSDIRERFVYGIQPESTELLLSLPDFQPTPGKDTCYLTTWESTLLPSKYVDILNRAKAVVVPSEWNATCFSACGVTVPIRVVPLGINPEIFHFRDMPKAEVFTFGCGGRLLNGIDRKGLHQIIRLFQVAFKPTDKVRLKVKCQPDCPIGFPHDSRIELIKSHLTEAGMAEWYSSLDCFVSFTTGAWELMPHQAMACGRPVLGIKYAGMAEYLSPEASFIVPHILVPAGDKWRGMGSWGRPEDVDVISAMRWIVENPKVVEERGWKSAGIAQQLSWENSVNKVVGVMESFGLVGKPKPQATEKRRKCFVQLGRIGDIVSILPIVREEERTSGQKPVLMVAQEFASVLEGITYAQPVYWDGPYEAVNHAVEHAQKVYPDVVVTHTYGSDYSTKLHGDNFNRDQWRLAGYIDRFDDLPLVFDRRDYEREKALADGLLVAGKRNVVMFMSGRSSPFQHRQAVKDALQKQSDVTVLDLSDLLAFRPYDILGVMERANLVICSDSAPLHIAAATNTPTIAFTADLPSSWHGTDPRGRVLLKMPYSAVPERLQAIHQIVTDLPNPDRLLHVYQDFPGRGDSYRRNEVARRTWRTVYSDDRWVGCGTSEGSLPRMFPDDRRTLPYIKDLIDQAVLRAMNEQEIVVLTNTDSCLASNTAESIRATVGAKEAAFCYRQDFPLLTEPLSLDAIKTGQPYPGCDLFCFTVRWWKKHGHRMPDMVLGGEAWDWVLRELIRSLGGGQVTNLVYHERHETEWEKHRFSLACNRHNHALGKPVLMELGVYSGEFDR